MAETLAVWLNDDRVGELQRDARGFKFLAEAGAKSLTAAGAGAATPWPRDFARNWFDGLLPEAAERVSAENRHGVANGDTFGLLAEVGWECAGAVSVLPDGRRPVSGSYQSLTDAEVLERLDALPLHVGGDLRVRLSLGGAQEKLLLHRSGDGWDLPLDGAISTHILKPDPRTYPGLAAAEAFCLEAASHATPTASSKFWAVEGHRPTLVVERFDREAAAAAAAIARIHQEDGCQAAGLPPARKYHDPGVRATPGIPQHLTLARILSERAADAPTELLRLLEQVTVNMAVGNLDAHLKNYSIQHVRGAVRLSPLYDVSPTRAFIPTERYAALAVGGKQLYADVTRSALVAEARLWGVPAQRAGEVVAATLGRLAEGVERAKSRYPAATPAAVAEVERNLRRLRDSA